LPWLSLIYLDTNVLVHAFEPKSLTERAVSNALLRLFLIELKGQERAFRTSEFTFGELWVGAYKQEKLGLIAFYESLCVSNSFLQVDPVNLQILRGAALLRVEYPALKTPDAIHLAAAMVSGCDFFLTSDARLKDEYLMVNRSGGTYHLHGRVEVIRPDVETLTRLSVQMKI
jgi:predicted nucleic acid-binding protein